MGINMNINIKGQVEKVNGKEMSYSEFVERFMEKNQPVVLTGLMDHHWKASTDWVTPHGQPNLPFFSTLFGASKVQVADCDTRDFTDQKREEMLVSDFIGRCLQIEGSAVQCNNENGTSNGHSVSVPYLKDWHFVKEYPEYVAYITPTFFCDDWLNLYLDNYRMHTCSDTDQQNDEICSSDYRFVYMGMKGVIVCVIKSSSSNECQMILYFPLQRDEQPNRNLLVSFLLAGSWTPLHADVFRSYSWSANVCGKKRWFFLDPSQCHLVFDRNVKSCVYNIFDEVADSKYPGFKKAIWLECTQEAGEVIFVPSGWYHQVHNLAYMQAVNLSASSFYVPGNNSSKYLNYGATVSEVEIDLLTGETRFLQTNIIYDCGQSLNPAVDLGQIEGSFIQGLGFFMLEEYETNLDGLVLEDGTWNYKIPTTDTIPQQFNAQ